MNAERRPLALWLHLHLGDLPLEIISRGSAADRVAAVAEGDGSRARIVCCSRPARALGIEPGMALGGAWALAAALEVRRRDPSREAAALNRVAAWAMQFSSFVAVEPPCGICLEIAGSLKLFGGFSGLLDRVRSGLSSLGYAARWAAAPTPTAAGLMARAGVEEAVLDMAALPSVLAPIALDHLALDASELVSLERLGLRKIADCFPLPRAGLGRRVAGVLETLDRAMGRSPDPRAAHELAAKFEEVLALPVPVFDVDALLFATNRLLYSLHGFLGARGSGANALTLRLDHESSRRTRTAGCYTPVELSLVSPVRCPGHLLGLLREKLIRIELSAPVERIAMEVSQMAPLAPTVDDLFETGKGRGPAGDEESFARLVERLCARLGEHAVLGLSLVADHRPERAWSAHLPRQGPVVQVAVDRDAPRPIWLLPVPALLPSRDGRPGCRGPLTLSPPERIEAGWWDGEDVAREYFLARNPRGEMLWVFRDRRACGCWYLQGIFG